eukprot:scaffold431341_cov38-Prasinocladus_malaysianus.AAC.1
MRVARALCQLDQLSPVESRALGLVGKLEHLKPARLGRGRTRAGRPLAAVSDSPLKQSQMSALCSRPGGLPVPRKVERPEPLDHREVAHLRRTTARADIVAYRVDRPAHAVFLLGGQNPRDDVPLSGPGGKVAHLAGVARQPSLAFEGFDPFDPTLGGREHGVFVVSWAGLLADQPLEGLHVACTDCVAGRGFG